MKTIARAGEKIDREIWFRLSNAGDEKMKHRLWVSVIKEVATLVLERNPDVRQTLAGSDSNNSGDDLEELQGRLIETWLDDATPASHDLASILGELDYFRNTGLWWGEVINFSGWACGYTGDVVFDLQNRLEGCPDAREAITDDLVDEFYTFWRTSFLNKVLEAAQSLIKGGSYKLPYD